MSQPKFILDANGKPVPEPNLIKWANWFESANRIVKQEWIGESRVSTVFLGLDYNFHPSGPPVLWETMVFNGRLNGEMTRCSGTREQAEAMHAEMISRVQATLIARESPED